MVCYYHPERESTDICAICGKSVCKECCLEIAGKTYCKDCLEKIVGLGIENNSNNAGVQDSSQSDPVRLERMQEDSYYDEDPYGYSSGSYEKSIGDDSPYNIRKDPYSGGYESSYEKSNLERQPQIAQNEYDYYSDDQYNMQQSNQQDYIYPEHSYQPEPRTDLEDKYEKYLDDLYYDENEVPLDEQLAKDEEQYGSLTRRQYPPRQEEAQDQLTPQQRRRIPKNETPEEMEARIRAEIAQEQGLKNKIDGDKIHNLNYDDKKEPMGVVDIILTIILVIVVLIVIYYLIYLFALHTYYPTFMDALYGLTNPQNVINNLLSGS